MFVHRKVIAKEKTDYLVWKTKIKIENRHRSQICLKCFSSLLLLSGLSHQCSIWATIILRIVMPSMAIWILPFCVRQYIIQPTIVWLIVWFCCAQSCFVWNGFIFAAWDEIETKPHMKGMIPVIDFIAVINWFSLFFVYLKIHSYIVCMWITSVNLYLQAKHHLLNEESSNKVSENEQFQLDP